MFSPHVCLIFPTSTGGRPGVRKRRLSRRSRAIRHQQTLRRKLKKTLQPIEDKLTAFVRQTWPQACNRNSRRKCRPCFSLIRQYLPGERRTHNIHRDDHALVTAVVSFSDYGRDFLGLNLPLPYEPSLPNCHSH